MIYIFIYVGNSVPPDRTNRRKELDQTRRYPDGSGVNRIQGHIYKYVSGVLVKTIFVNSLKVI